MADVKSQKKKAKFGISTGKMDNKNACMESYGGSDWNPGASKFKKRKRKGHNNFKTWQNK